MFILNLRRIHFCVLVILCVLSIFALKTSLRAENEETVQLAGGDIPQALPPLPGSRTLAMEAGVEPAMQLPGNDTILPTTTERERALIRKDQELAARGDVESQMALGDYLSGQNCFSEAAKWYEMAAKQGRHDAQYSLGELYSREGGHRDFAKAVKWYRAAALGGNSCAQRALGIMYLEGQGVQKNTRKAVSWLRKGASNHDFLAQFHLGELYARGTSLPEDQRRAAGWYYEAASRGYPEAQRRLGELYLQGLGVDKDYVQAHKWFYLSSAKAQLNEAEKKMTPDEISWANDLAAMWRPVEPFAEAYRCTYVPK